MRLIVGLGNYGAQYSGTRHNVGMAVVKTLAQRWSIPVTRTLCRAKVGKGCCGNHLVCLALPQTLMNGSGESVACLLKRHPVALHQLLVVCDDVSLPLGMIRLRAGGSDAGHRGLRSVLEAVGSEEIPRLRVGIQAEVPPRDLTAYVLGRFRAQEQPLLEEGMAKAVEASYVWLTHGMPTAMNRFNIRARRACRV